MQANISDTSTLSINIKWLVQITVFIGTAVYLYLGLESRIKNNEAEIVGLRFNQNNYVFPDIRNLETEVIEFKLERERIRKDIARLNEKLKNVH